MVSGGFNDESGVFFPNSFNPMFSSWSGWSISSMTDTVTRGFMNDFSSISGGGNDASRTYATSYAPNPVRLTFWDLRNDADFKGLYINNSTYAYHSMNEGDGFAKKFGGIDGTDPDFFKLTIHAYVNDELKEDSIEFYLADFRSDDSEEDYIISEWTYVDLSPLGAVDSLEFSLSSSDVGNFGMNTPAYFCVDDITFKFNPLSTLNQALAPLEFYPNPTVDHVTLLEGGRLQILTSTGRSVLSQVVRAQEEVDVSFMPDGTYLLMLEQNGLRYTGKLIKN